MARDRHSRPEARPLRLFIAVDVPDDVRERLSETVEPMRRRIGRARWVPPENWHVTLKFLGRTWPRLVDWVFDSTDLVARTEPAFETSLRGLGVFPSPKRARVLWAGLGDPGTHLARMASTLDEAMVKEFKPEKRAFTPHLTLARFDPPAAIQDGLPEVASAPFPIDRLIVYRSHLQRPAPRYEVVHEARLTGPT